MKLSLEKIKEKTLPIIHNNISMLKKVSIGVIGGSIFLSLILSIYSCSALTKRNSNLREELETLTSNFEEIKKDNESFLIKLESFDELKMKILTDLAINKLKLEQYDEAVFNVADGGKGFARLNSSTGMFFLLLDKAEDFSDGYKLSFRLGNPQNCVYNGCKLMIRWGKKHDRENKDISYEDWYKSLKNSEVTIKDKLIPGQWHNFDITISPAKLEDIQYIELNIQAEQISMQEKENKE